MATVYGCIAPATGEITFADLESCLGQTSCEVVTAGAHAGQVALTLSGADDPACNDTFYGCVNWTTGKFQVIIPDNCCVSYPECPCQYTNYIPECYPTNETPRFLLIILEGIRDSGTDELVPFNGIYCMVYEGETQFDGWGRQVGYTVNTDGGIYDGEDNILFIGYVPVVSSSLVIIWPSGYDAIWVKENPSSCSTFFSGPAKNGTTCYGGTATIINPCD